MSDQDVVDKAADNAGVDRSLLSGVWAAESGRSGTGKNPDGTPIKSKTGVQGQFQITKSTWQKYSKQPYPSTDLSEQARVAAALLKVNLTSYRGDVELALIAYNAGVVADYISKDGMSVADAVAAAVNKGQLAVPKGMTKEDYIAQKTTEVAGYKKAVTGEAGRGAGTRGSSYFVQESEGAATDASPLSVGSLSEAEFNQLNNEALYDPEGLVDVVPWYDDLTSSDGSLVTANPRLQGSSNVSGPVWFQVRLRDSTSDYLCEDEEEETPAKIVLNCSLSALQTTHKHRSVTTPTRTGIHVTLWGMEPDVLTGSGSTGAWMNQYGLTSWMSTLQEAMPDDIVDFASSQFGSRDPGDDVDEPYRVGAQDAFAELLALFKYNAITRFKSENYSDLFSDREQLGSNLWSEAKGVSKFMEATRNGDVMYRGLVELHTSRDVYHGFFKSLSFSEDSEKPFRWNFEFTFQVQKVTKALAFPVY